MAAIGNNFLIAADASATSHGAQVLICVIAALVVFRHELQRRLGDASGGLRGPGAGAFLTGANLASCTKIIKSCAPELAGVAACLLLAALLRLHGAVDNVHISTGDVDASEPWKEIKAQWPLLITADTMLSLQAMLRLVVFFSAARRASAVWPVEQPLAGETAMLLLCAQLARAFLTVRTSVYRLDGPLGGSLPVVCDIAAVPLLVALASSALRRSPGVLAISAVGVAWLARRHHLSLAEAAHTDGLFIAAHIFDTLAAVVYIARSLLIGGAEKAVGAGATVGLTHLLMVAQQSLSAYYFLTAFEASDALVGAGLPFHILQLGNLAQLGLYLCAAATYLAEHLLGDDVSTSPPHAGQRIAVAL